MSVRASPPCRLRRAASSSARGWFRFRALELFLLNTAQIFDQEKNTGAYVGLLSIGNVGKAFSGVDRLSLAPNRHITWTVTSDLQTSVNHAADALGWKYSPISLG